MSRSFKKNNYHSVTIRGSRSGVQKSWKKNCNRKLRRTKNDIPDGSKYRKISGDVWHSPSDGKFRSEDDKRKRK